MFTNIGHRFGHQAGLRYLNPSCHFEGFDFSFLICIFKNRHKHAVSIICFFVNQLTRWEKGFDLQDKQKQSLRQARSAVNRA